jgi:hypothetical protein
MMAGCGGCLVSVGEGVSALSGGGQSVLYPLGSPRNAYVGIAWSHLGWGSWGCCTLHVIICEVVMYADDTGAG